MATPLPFALTFIRNYTVEPILPALKREFAGRGLQPQCTFGEFADAAADIRALPVATDADADRGMVVLTLSLELYSREFGHADWKCREACENVLALVRMAIERSTQPLVLNTLLPPLTPVTGFAAFAGQPGHAQQVEELNLELRGLAAAHPGRVILLDWVAYARELGEANTYDLRFWHSSGLPFASAFLKRFAADLAAVAEVLAGRARKCLVLDCDNTLWGGVVGEDGLGGIRLSADSAPGVHYREFQRVVLDLHRQGVLLAICSKNNEGDVFDVLDNHPDGLLKREHLAAWRIDWNDKAQSIAELARELNIGVDALVFVDDSPQECERVRQALPDVRVLQLPEKAEALPRFLQAANPFPRLTLTAEDAQRSRSYRDNRDRGALATLAGDAGAYRQLLGTRMRARPAREQDLDRIAQLFQKTNQFNLTTRRHDRGEVGRMAGDPDTLVFCADVADKFGELGLVAVAVASRGREGASIDSFLLSCRALGRDAEFEFLARFVDAIVGAWGVDTLRARFLPTAKNAQVADFWSRAGFQPEPDAAGPGSTYVVRGLAQVIADNRRTYIEEED